MEVSDLIRHHCTNVKINEEFAPYAVGGAAEAFAAGVLAHAGYDVSVQYGANRPGYDIVALKQRRTLRVSVKGSNVGGWGFSQNLKKGRTFSAAADEWLRRNSDRELVFMLLHFENTALGECPNIYVARPKEIFRELKKAKGGHGASYITVIHTYKRVMAKGITDKIPDTWKFSLDRIDSV